ncbi:unnamed protein product, partial [Mesorhabditis belari]|uniref:Uncharacterized protein n=1 Tax=Mesorhabditis belari TaxID=2138241 RepID=A0AAF3FLC5_9BILA
MDFSNCTVVEMYVKSGFLKSLMIVQASSSIFYAFSQQHSLLVVSTELCLSICLLKNTCWFVTGFKLFNRLLLVSYRFISNIPMNGLPFVNAALTIFRLLIFLLRTDCKRKQMQLLRICELLTILCFVLDSSYRYWGVEFPEKVAYCTGNMQQLAAKLNLESYISLGMEVVTNLIGIWLFRKHKQDLSHKDKRSYDVNVTLMRRQIMYTYILFLPYSILHTISFGVFNLVSIFYRNHFYALPEPDYSAGSGFTYIPLYFSVFSPWILYLLC